MIKRVVIPKTKKKNDCSLILECMDNEFDVYIVLNQLFSMKSFLKN